ncbi:hypothetical protein FKW77_003218 [Venturia effusa]|uniref:Carboxylic ester hydrolase n=1 Tax=Venturia effusa TaxID=50376 RepID=A0A517LC34_9PEZI|nr:hypothetical protein FKW77_003218 [Venturia effusa]
MRSTAMLVACMLAAVIAGHGQAAVVKLDTGVYKATTRQVHGSNVNVDVFLGLPFAAPPLGPLRFAPPQKPTTSTSAEIRLANNLAPACIQSGGSSKFTESEDCLYLNIYAPSPFNDSSGRTVMFWLYGGGLQYGSVSQPLYDGTNLAANQDVIVVMPNYRLNIFGFPGEIPEISPKDRNLGLLDQRQALAWVQQNVAKFGGDPSKVTVFGESAGARSADFHILTMRANPPFRAVIMQSGSAEVTPLADIKKAKESARNGPAFQQLARALNCTVEQVALSCLRNVSAVSIKQMMTDLALYSGTMDDGGFATVKDQAEARRGHQAADVPLLIGSNADEVRGSLRRWKENSLDEYLLDAFGDQPELRYELAKAYASGSGKPYETEFDAIAAIATDMSFNCITAREARISSESGYPTWRYLFNASYPNTEKFPGGGANHAHEIQFVFGNLPGGSTREELELSKLMQKTWADFAKDPRAGLGWDNFGAPGRSNLGRFDRDGKVRAGSAAALDRNCGLFEPMYTGRA